MLNNEDISISTYCCNFMYNFFFLKTKYCKKYFFFKFLINFSSYLNDAVSLQAPMKLFIQLKLYAHDSKLTPDYW